MNNDNLGSPNQEDKRITAMPTTPGTPLFRDLSLSPPTNTEKQHINVAEYAIASIAYQILWGLSYLHYEGVHASHLQIGR